MSEDCDCQQCEDEREAERRQARRSKFQGTVKQVMDQNKASPPPSPRQEGGTAQALQSMCMLLCTVTSIGCASFIFYSSNMR